MIIVNLTYHGKHQERKTRSLRSIVESAKSITNRSEERRGTKGGKIDEQEVHEIQTGVDLETCHEIDDESEHDNHHKVQRHIAYRLSEQDSRRSVHGKAFML